MTGPTTASSGSPKKPAPADAGVSPGSMGLVSCLCGHLIMSKPPGWSGSSALLDKLSISFVVALGLRQVSAFLIRAVMSRQERISIASITG